MTKRDDSVYLGDILAEATSAVAFCDGIMQDELEANLMTLRAVERSIEIIGEAASKVSKATKDQFPSLPWKQMKGMRNTISHQYWGADSDVLFSTVKDDLPEVIRLLTEAGIKPTQRKKPSGAK